MARRRRSSRIRRATVAAVTVQLPPSLADLEALAKSALVGLPRSFKDQLGPVVIRVDEFPDAETEAAMRLDSPFDLLGLYRGVALPLKSVSDPRPEIDMILLIALGLARDHAHAECRDNHQQVLPAASPRRKSTM